ncbi:MAG: hypothetical protein ABIE43_02070 [Patescibacteria group bacterium]
MNEVKGPSNVIPMAGHEHKRDRIKPLVETKIPTDLISYNDLQNALFKVIDEFKKFTEIDEISKNLLMADLRHQLEELLKANPALKEHIDDPGKPIQFLESIFQEYNRLHK